MNIVLTRILILHIQELQYFICQFLKKLNLFKIDNFSVQTHGRFRIQQNNSDNSDKNWPTLLNNVILGQVVN